MTDTISTTRKDGETVESPIRCAFFIPGGVQCVREMYHKGACVYEPETPFSTHVVIQPTALKSPVAGTKPPQGR